MSCTILTVYHYFIVFSYLLSSARAGQSSKAAADELYHGRPNLFIPLHPILHRRDASQAKSGKTVKSNQKTQMKLGDSQ